MYLPDVKVMYCCFMHLSVLQPLSQHHRITRLICVDLLLSVLADYNCFTHKGYFQLILLNLRCKFKGMKMISASYSNVLRPGVSI